MYKRIEPIGENFNKDDSFFYDQLVLEGNCNKTVAEQSKACAIVKTKNCDVQESEENFTLNKTGLQLNYFKSETEIAESYDGKSIVSYHPTDETLRSRRDVIENNTSTGMSNPRHSDTQFTLDLLPLSGDKSKNIHEADRCDADSMEGLRHTSSVSVVDIVGFGESVSPDLPDFVFKSRSFLQFNAGAKFVKKPHVKVWCFVCKKFLIDLRIDHHLTEDEHTERIKDEKYIKTYKRSAPGWSVDRKRVKALPVERCNICSLSFSDASSLRSHEEEWRHLKNASHLEDDFFSIVVRSVPDWTRKGSGVRFRKSGFFCSVCCLSIDTVLAMKSHLSGLRHRDTCFQLMGDKCADGQYPRDMAGDVYFRNHPYIEYRCRLCCTTFDNYHAIQYHLSSPGHIQRVSSLYDRDSEGKGRRFGGDRHYIPDYVCNGHFRSEAPPYRPLGGPFYNPSKQYSHRNYTELQQNSASHFASNSYSPSTHCYAGSSYIAKGIQPSNLNLRHPFSGERRFDDFRSRRYSFNDSATYSTHSTTGLPHDAMDWSDAAHSFPQFGTPPPPPSVPRDPESESGGTASTAGDYNLSVRK